ncbi:MAG TPA: beta-lactamase family protein [Dehalococcoidia bacterium]|nr:beta-lactamase family protein [Dehalococcoidia bacterium]
MADAVEIQGYCAPGFENVKAALARAFEVEGDVGASFAATIDGEFVVDIWAGYADAARTRPWEKDTIANVWSTTKTMTVLCALILVDRGQLDLDAPVSHYWPEFAQAGKEKILVRHILSHTSGLAGFEATVTAEDLYNWDHIVGLLAAQKPWWEPGTKSGYHSITFGYLVGEVIRRITGKTLGTFFREEVAVPLGADFHIGLAAEHDARVAELIPPPRPQPGDPSYINPEDRSELARTVANPTLPAAVTTQRAWRAAEIPAVNGHGNARSVARVAAVMACGGELNGMRLLSMPTIEKIIEEQCYSTDLVLRVPIRWGLGFALNTVEAPIVPNPRAFFWGGAGGSLVVIDLDVRVSFAYAMNKMGFGTMGDKRSIRPARALYASM